MYKSLEVILQHENLSKNARSIQDFLLEHGFTCKVIELPLSTRTAAEAALAIGCEVAQIMKSILFQGHETKQPILVLASGINRINEKTLEAHIGEKIHKADAEYTKESTGFTIGGIPPIGHKKFIQTFIDEDLLNFEQLWAAAGTPNAVFCLSCTELLSLVQAKVISIK